MSVLVEARALDLPDWWLAAGFVRNLVWDRLHGYIEPTPLNDIDLVYFDPSDLREGTDRKHERRLRRDTGQPWSVKNQARMHQRHGHTAYSSIEEALSVWVECETAIGVTLDGDDRLRLVAPFGMASLLAGKVTPNPRHGDLEVFWQRVAAKAWRHQWPELRISGLADQR